MFLLRAIAIVLIALGCAALPQSCLISALCSSDQCCQEEAPSSCAACTTLHSGADRPAGRIKVTVKVAVADQPARRSAPTLKQSRTIPPITPHPENYWDLIGKTAPVRGPSCAA